MNNTTNIFIYLIQLLAYIDVCFQNSTEDKKIKLSKISPNLYKTLSEGFIYTETGIDIIKENSNITFKRHSTDLYLSLWDIMEYMGCFGDTTKLGIFLKIYTKLNEVFPETIQKILKDYL